MRAIALALLRVCRRAGLGDRRPKRVAPPAPDARANAVDAVDRIFLVGAMGAGKSSAGRVLAQALSWSFVDLDERVEARAGQQIEGIFAQRGEDAFRQLEHECLLHLRSETGIVVATGGGTVLRADNRNFLRQSAGHYCVFLSASLRALASRLDGAQRRGRPLLQGSHWRKNLETLLNQRRQLWTQCAHQTVVTDQSTVEEVCARILRRLTPALKAAGSK